MKKIRLTTPLDESDIRALRAGDQVQISGVIYSARDMAHKKLTALINESSPLPFELAGAAVYYLGPTPAREGEVIGAAGPTTSSRMDPFTPLLLSKGVKATLGKGYRSPEVVRAFEDNTAVHLAVTGGAGALLSRCIISSEVIAFADLGTEAVRRMEVENFPAIVAYDSIGGSVYR